MPKRKDRSIKKPHRAVPKLTDQPQLAEPPTTGQEEVPQEESETPQKGSSGMYEQQEQEQEQKDTKKDDTEKNDTKKQQSTGAGGQESKGSGGKQDGGDGDDKSKIEIKDEKPGNSFTAKATFVDDDGEEIEVEDPSKITWQATPSSALELKPNPKDGSCTGKAVEGTEGSFQIVATEPESGKSATGTVTVKSSKKKSTMELSEGGEEDDDDDNGKDKKGKGKDDKSKDKSKGK